jgi:3-oxoacyl-[acyl-carrier-protein] synthase-1
MRSGVRYANEFDSFDFSSRVAAWPQFDVNAHFDRKQRRFMGLTAAYAYAAAQQAIAQAQLSDAMVQHPRTGLIAGSGAGSACEQITAFEILQSRGARRINPYIVPKWMASTVSANLATLLRLRGVSYSITAACATSAHCIGSAYQQIRHGLHDVMLCGGSEEVDPYNFMLFDAMGALSSHSNNAPTQASRPFDSSSFPS